MSSYHMAGFNVAFGHDLFVKLMREVFEISGDGHSMNDFLMKMNSARNVKTIRNY